MAVCIQQDGGVNIGGERVFDGFSVVYPGGILRAGVVAGAVGHRDNLDAVRIIMRWVASKRLHADVDVIGRLARHGDAELDIAVIPGLFDGLPECGANLRVGERERNAFTLSGIVQAGEVRRQLEHTAALLCVGHSVDAIAGFIGRSIFEAICRVR